MLDYLSESDPAELLQKHQDLLRKIESFSAVGHWRVDLIENTLFWSDEVYKIHGLDKENFKPDLESAIEFYHSDDREDVKKLVNRAIENAADFNFQKRLIRPDGELRYVVAYGQCEVNQDGEVIALFGVFKDETRLESRRKEASDALKFLQEIVDQIPDLIFVKDEALKIVFANKAFLELYGDRPDRVLGHTTFEKFPDHEAKAFMAQDTKALAAGFTQTEEEVTDYQGNTNIYLTRKQSFKNQFGERFLLGVATNITQQKKEAEILRKIYQISSDRGFSLDARIHEILRLACEYFDLPFGIVSRIKADMYRVINAYDANRNIKVGDIYSFADTYCAHTFKGDQVRSFDNVSESHIADHPCYNKFKLNSYIGIPLYVGGERYGTVNFSGPDPRRKAFSAAEHSFIRMISHWIGHEITESKYMARLRESEERYELAAKGSASALWDWDVEDDYIHWTGAVQSVLGYKNVDDLPNKSEHFSELVHPDDQDKLREAMAMHFKTRAPFELELRVKRENGQYIWTYNRAQALWEYSGKAVRMYGSMTNIDDRKKMEDELRRSNEELEQYASIVSHDLHQPLRAIQGFLDLLVMTNEEKLDEKALEYIDNAQTASEHLSVIIDELLEYSRYNKEQQELAEVNTAQAIDTIQDMLQPIIHAKSGILELSGDFPVIRYDEKQFSRLMTNLIENGIKYSSKAAPVINVSVEECETHWIFSVADNGIGIKDKYLNSVFDMFTRLKTKQGVDGTGIGLAICRKIVEGHDGEIWVESEEGQGATFKFTVPRRAD